MVVPVHIIDIHCILKVGIIYIHIHIVYIYMCVICIYIYMLYMYIQCGFNSMLVYGRLLNAQFSLEGLGA